MKLFKILNSAIDGIVFNVTRVLENLLLKERTPIMGGFEAAAKLRRAGYAGLMIALTAHALTDEKEQGLEAGFDFYQTKLVRFDQLIERITSVIKPRKSDTIKASP